MAVQVKVRESVFTLASVCVSSRERNAGDIFQSPKGIASDDLIICGVFNAQQTVLLQHQKGSRPNREGEGEGESEDLVVGNDGSSTFMRGHSLCHL